MAPAEHPDLLTAVVNLTRQREPESLAIALLDSIATLTSANNIRIYSLDGELGKLSARVMASNNPLEPVGAHITPLDSHHGFKACIDGKYPVISQLADRFNVTYPILDQGIVTGLMTHDYALDADPQHELISRMMEIYANQHSLLNHQQRDGLTGLFNRVALQNWLSKSLGHDAREVRRLNDDVALGCFALFDIDYFKRINDTRGHLYGDEVLVIFADLMRESFRFNDLLFRYGGEEFVAILTDTELEAALTVLERFRTHVSQHRFHYVNQVTITIGVARITRQLNPERLVDRADKALYYGKENGRNQVNAFEWLEQGHILPSLDDLPHTIKLF